MRFIVLAVLAFGIYQIWYHPGTFLNFFNGGVHEVTVEQLGYDLRQQSGKKVVLLFTTDFANCPCQGSVPAIDAQTFPSDVTRDIVSLDKDKASIDRYKKYFTNANVNWFWLGKSCTTPHCAELSGPLGQIGINYPGQMPYIEILDGTSPRSYAQSPPAEFAGCIAANTCSYNCVGNRCSIKQ